jgi:hypothetical protein
MYQKDVPQTYSITFKTIYQVYASNMCQHHKDVPLTMNHNIHRLCTKGMSQACINFTKTCTSNICIHVPKGLQDMPQVCAKPSMIQVSKTHKKYTFTHEEYLVHIITDQLTNLVQIIFNKLKIKSFINFLQPH